MIRDLRGGVARAARAASAIGVILLVPCPGEPVRAAEIPADDQCAICHAEMEDEAVDVAEFFSVDVHARAGLSCADCHGGDRTSDDEDVAMSDEAGFRGAPGILEIPDFCARCHSDASYMRQFNPRLPVDQFERYLTSRHGQANRKGDPKVATCVSCHGVHGIRPPSEPLSKVHPQRVASTCGRCHSDPERMGEYGLPTNQVALYEKSVHGVPLLEGRDLSSPTCNDCHGNHGANPPETDSIHSVCGFCHAHNREYFDASVKAEIFEEIEEPGCITCHGNHGVRHPTDADLGLGEGAVCADCHDDDGSDASRTILAMRSSLDFLRAAVEEGDSLLAVAEQKGMYVVDSELKWRSARQKLFRARTAIHQFDAETLAESASEGVDLAEEVLAEASGALDAFVYRRNGLLVSTLIVTVLVGALYVKIRSLESE